MSDDENKYNVDDILAEFDSEKTDGQTAETEQTEELIRETEQAENPVQEAGQTEELIQETERAEDPVQEDEDSLQEAEKMGSSLQKMDEMMSSMRKAEKNASPAEQADASGQEEYDDYEDGEEQELSAEFAQEPMFRPAELFDGSSADPVNEEDPEPEEEEFETSEEIFADEDDGDNEDSGELSEEDQELIEETEPETGTYEEFPEEDSRDEEVHTWAENGIPGEITDIDVDVPEETDGGEEYGKTEEDAPPVSLEKKPAEFSEEPEDADDKWLTRLAKSIFPAKGDSVGEIIRKIVFLIALTVFIGAGVMLASTLIQSAAARRDGEAAKELIMTTVGTYIDEDGNFVTIAPTEEEKAQHLRDVADFYKNINSDYVGYLEVEGCDIYTPIVQGEDNDTYLKTNIFGGYNKAGTVFMDYRCAFDKDYQSPNIVLYGHNQEDGTMFGNLKNYKLNVEFYREHPTVKLSSEYETGEYLIYGFFVTHVYASQDSNGEVFHYHDYIETLNDEYTFNWYLNEVQKRNQIISPVDVRFGDRLLCLSTCSNEFTDSRFVIFARKLREGETAEDYDFSQAYMNPNAASLDWAAIITGDPTYSPETDIIEEIPEETEAVTTSEKSNNKSNSGSGLKNGEPAVIPPPAETTTTVVPEAETEKTEETTTSIPLQESSVTDPSGENSDTETREQQGTEASAQETAEQTETAA